MDLAAYLQRELAMEYLYVAAADGQFGNAIMSRLPMEEIEQGKLPEGVYEFSRAEIWWFICCYS